MPVPGLLYLREHRDARAGQSVAAWVWLTAFVVLYSAVNYLGIE